MWSATRVQKGVLVGPPSAHVKAQSTASSELSSTGFNYYVTKDIIIYQRGEDSVHSHCHTSMTGVTKRSPSIVAVRQEAIGNVCHDRKVGVDADGLKALKLVYEKKL